MRNNPEHIIRKAHGAGRWFPSDKNQLRDMVENFINNAEVPRVSKKISAAIAPHAGYIYSGDTAGHTFKAISLNTENFSPPETVVVLGFSHRHSFRGTAIMDGSAIQTPLGTTVLDNDAGAFLTSTSPLASFNYTPHETEHSAENLVPFIQTALPAAKLVIALTGSHDKETVTELSESLCALAKEKNIIVTASTDMLHDPDYNLVTETDRATLELVAEMKIKDLNDSWSSDKQIFCGITPVLAAMTFAQAQGCSRGIVTAYKNSGDDFPESRGEWVVGYGSVIFI